jgi:hypothetical protein
MHDHMKIFCYYCLRVEPHDEYGFTYVQINSMLKNNVVDAANDTK